jgi:hypothetical protein
LIVTKQEHEGANLNADFYKNLDSDHSALGSLSIGPANNFEKNYKD